MTEPALREALALITARRRDWSPPGADCAIEVQCDLAGGSSNRSYLLRAGVERLVLRLDGIEPAHNGIDRETEFRLQRGAAAAGLAPQPRFVDCRAGVFLSDYLAPDAGQPQDSVAETLALLRAIHGLAIEAPRLRLRQRVSHYARQLQSRGNAELADLLSALSPSLERLCGALDCDQDDAVLCHNDLTAANRLWHDGRLYALDWEYAARGSRWFDLAVAMDRRGDAAQYLCNYLQRAPTTGEATRFAGARRVARYLEILWLGCNRKCTPGALITNLRDLQSWPEPGAAIEAPGAG